MTFIDGSAAVDVFEVDTYVYVWAGNIRLYRKEHGA